MKKIILNNLLIKKFVQLSKSYQHKKNKKISKLFLYENEAELNKKRFKFLFETSILIMG